MAGLLDFLADPVERRQIGANALAATTRGIVAGGLGAPVDMLHTLANLGIAGVGYLGNKAGLIPNDKLPALLPEPVGGSEWIGRQMQKGGLLSSYRNPNAELIAGGLLAPAATVAVQARAPQIARGLLQMQENAAKPSTLRNVSQRGIFGGELAQTADKAALAKAKALEGKGTDPRAIWQETGWFKGGDGKWRFEIDDSASLMAGVDKTDEMLAAFKQGGKPAMDARRAELANYVRPYERMDSVQNVDDVMAHRKLFEAYPDARSIVYWQENSPRIGEGSYSPKTDAITLTPANEPTARSAMLHELQHAIQKREGFAAGGMPDGMDLILQDVATTHRKNAERLRSLAYANDPLDPSRMVKPGARAKAIKEEAKARQAFDWLSRIDSFGDGYAQKAYQSLAGEAEARAVQARMNMTPAQRRATFPLDSYDVPIDSLIYWNGR